MVKFLKRMVSGEEGQALPIVLALLVLGGLTIVPSLNYITTSLNGGRIVQEGVDGVYAAEAGVEDALWSLVNGISPSPQLTENINQMAVAIQSEEKGDYTLYYGTLVETRQHSDYLDVDTAVMWDEGAQAYKYTITVTWQAEPGTPSIKLKEVGARLPVGYTYQSGSAAGFAGNLSFNGPIVTLDTAGAYLLNWEFDSPRPSIDEDNPVQTQTFYADGEGSEGGDYAWVVAQDADIGIIGEIIGALYTITATATRADDGETTTRIVTDVMIEEEVYIITWQIFN